MKPRNIRKYSPRRRRSNKELQIQQLKDYEHLLSMDLGSFLILSKEGSEKQKQEAAEKLARDFRKYSGELVHIAKELGSPYPEPVEKYNRLMKEILLNSKGKIDINLINEQRRCADQIRKLSAA